MKWGVYEKLLLSIFHHWLVHKCFLWVGEARPPVEEFKYLSVMFLSDARMELKMDEQIRVLSSLMRVFLWLVIVKRVELKSEALDLLVCLRSNTHLWTRGLGRDRKKEILDTSCQNGLAGWSAFILAIR